MVDITETTISTTIQTTVSTIVSVVILTSIGVVTAVKIQELSQNALVYIENIEKNNILSETIQFN